MLLSHPDTRVLNLKDPVSSTQHPERSGWSLGEEAGAEAEKGAEVRDQASCKSGQKSSPWSKLPGTRGHRSRKMTLKFFLVSPILEKSKARWLRGQSVGTRSASRSNSQACFPPRLSFPGTRSQKVLFLVPRAQRRHHGAYKGSQHKQVLEKPAEGQGLLTGP